MTEPTVPEILNSYNDRAPLAEALTIPAPWYVDNRIAALERKTVFSRTWQIVGRADQVGKPGDYLTANVAVSRSWLSEVRTTSCEPSSTSAVTTLLRS